MKNLELTDEHIIKLSEMIKKLFPQYKKVKIEKGICCGENWFIRYDTRKIVSLGNCCSGYSKGEYFDIHWFEFCINDLTTLLYNLNKRDEITKIEFYRGDIIQNYHPIDYLYKEFKYYLNKDNYEY